MHSSANAKTSDVLNDIIINSEVEDNITLGKFIAAFGDRAFGIAIFVFALPNSFPIPSIPGFSAVTGLPILFFGLQLMLGYKQPWLPKKLRDYEFSQVKLASILRKIMPYIQKVEIFFKPRLPFMTAFYSERLIGVGIAILALILALPIPFGNFLPGIAITMLSIGLIEKDGLLVILGTISGIFATLIISTAITMIVKGLIMAAMALLG